MTGRVVFQVAARHHAAGIAHRGDDLVGDRADVEGARALASDRLQRLGEVGLDQDVARRRRGAVGLEEYRAQSDGHRASRGCAKRSES